MSLIVVLSVGLDSSLLGARSAVLRSAGYIVEVALSVKEAVSRFRAGDFDLIILCHSLPKEHRERLICMVREHGSHIPVISLSGKLCECDAFATATLEDGPNKFLLAMREVLLKAAKIPTLETAEPSGMNRAAQTETEKQPLSSGEYAQQQRKGITKDIPHIPQTVRASSG